MEEDGKMAKVGGREVGRGCSLDPISSEHHFLALCVVMYGDFINRQMACDLIKSEVVC